MIEELHRNRKLIAIDPKLLRATEAIHLMNEAKENDNDVKILAKMIHSITRGLAPTLLVRPSVTLLTPQNLSSRGKNKKGKSIDKNYPQLKA